FRFPEQSERFTAGRRRAHDLHVGFRLQEGSQTLQHGRVIVDNQNSNSLLRHPSYLGPDWLGAVISISVPSPSEVTTLNSAPMPSARSRIWVSPQWRGLRRAVC